MRVNKDTKLKTAIVSTLLVICALLYVPSISYAEDNSRNGIFSIVVENDIYQSDRYYTNGVKLSWLTESDDIPNWVTKAASHFPLFPIDSDLRANFTLGQNMYTPADIKLENPPRNDRPYAGWLYGSVGLIAETGNRLDQLELTIGAIGPNTFAEETQKTVHQLIGSDEPQGWDTQLSNEIGVILMYQRSLRSYVSESFLGVPFDITPNIGFSLGNVYTYANAGAVLRYGLHLPMDYGPPRIQPSLPGSGFFVPQKKLGWYLFAGFDGRAVARNIFLDGNTFAKSRSVEKEPLVLDVQAGIAVVKGNIRISYINVIRTKEFEHQKSSGQSFGTVSLSVQF